MKTEAKEFLDVVERYCAWVESERHDLIDARDLLIDLIKPIPIVDEYRGATETDKEFDRRGYEGWKKDMERFSDLPFQYYRTAFDPHKIDDAEAVVGDLHDDLADIYGDLHEALQALKAGYPIEALGLVLQSYHFHWGHHAVSALKAIDEFYRNYLDSEQVAAGNVR